MKYLLIVFALWCSYSYGQNTGQTEKKGNNENSFQAYPANTAEHDSLKAIKIFNDSIDYQVMLIDQNLNSINIKWDWIMNNPDEKAIADQEGWFDKMTIYKQELIEEKQLLLDSKK